MAEPRVAASQSETDSDPGYPLSTPSSGEFERSPDPLAVLSQPNAKAAGGGLWSSYRDAAERQCREEAGEDADEVNVAEDVFYASGAPQPVQGAVRGGAGASGHIAIPAPVAISGPTPSTSRLAGPGRGTRAPSPVDDRGRSPGQCGAERGVGSTGVGGGCRGAEAGPGGSPRVSGEPWGSVGREVGGTGARTPRESRSRAETRDVIMDSASMFERPSRGNWLEQDVVGGEAPGTGESAGERGARTSPGTAVEVELAVGGNRRSARRTWSPLRSRASSEREPTRVRSGPLPPAGPSDLCGSIALELEARSLSCGVLAAMDAEDADGSLPLTPREAAVRHAANMNRLSSSTPTPSVNSSAEHPRYLPSAGSALRMGVAGDPGWASSSTDRPIVARGVARQDGGHRPPARMAPRSSRGHAAGRDSRDHGVRCRARHHKAVSALCLDVLTETRSSWGSEGLDPRDPPRDMDPSCAARQAGYSYNFVPAPPPSDLSRPSSAPLSTMGEILIPAPSAEETGTGSYPGEDDDSSNGDGSWGISARTDVPPNGAASTMSISERYSGRLLCGRSPSWDRSSADRDVGDGRTSIDLYSDLRDSVSVRRRASFDVPGDRRDSVNRRSRHRETSCELETNPNLKMSGSGALARGSGPAVVSRVVTHMRRRSMEMLRRLCWRECDKPEAL
ncbi:unnamed protein product [Ostreobium quekettii]|uniref:Uncharacterized protein n=1 Tax=Ostreobium quekettii TaxID=121088 RepID=A0A8S1J8U2_9CHLO|nr:unnamed protein product [Ostreobium quekettii]